jgi:hypothetical protein
MAGMQQNTSPLAPVITPPETVSTFYERSVGNNTARRGPLRFEEGIGTDTSVPEDFVEGVRDGIIPAPGRPNSNRPVWDQDPAKTMQQRAHLGSASWVEAPTFLGSFAAGTSPEAEQRFIQTQCNGSRYERRNPAQVTD